jgi:glycerol-3-phosphate dehydrogenase
MATIWLPSSLEAVSKKGNQADMYDVAIIGGGVIGCAIARELSRYRLRAVVLEMCEEVGFGTTKTNSGIIHAGHHSSPETLKGRLVVRGNQLFDQLFDELNFGFARIGFQNIPVWHKRL